MSGALADLASVPKQSDGAPASIVVVAKCPIPGSSKTRLIPSLGADGAARLAEAMLADVLTTVSECVSSIARFNAPTVTGFFTFVVCLSTL